MGKMGICRGCDEFAWIIDQRGFCVECESARPDTLRIEGDVSGQVVQGTGNIQVQITLAEDAEVEQYAQSLGALFTMRENLQRIEKRMAEYVLSTDIPLQLVKEAERLRTQIRTLEEQLSLEGGTDVVST